MNDPKIYVTRFVATHIPTGQQATYHPMEEVRKTIGFAMAGRGMFSKLGEHWFDEYWMNYKKITVQDGNGGTKKISTLREFVEYKNGDVSLIVEKRNGEE